MKKAITNYNALGTATFIVSYVSTLDFEIFGIKFLEFLETHKFSLDVKRKMQNLSYPNASTRVAKTVLSRDGYDFPTYFITFKLLR